MIDKKKQRKTPSAEICPTAAKSPLASHHYMKRSALRKDFGLVDVNLPLPCLIQSQLDSYADFLQKDVLPENRKHTGLQAILKDNLQLTNASNTIKISFLNYKIEESYYNVRECKERGVTYGGSLKLSFEFITRNGDEVVNQEKEIYIGEIPLMTSSGTFIINGTERVIVSQLHRSPGIFFEKIDEETSSYYLCRVIPAKGLWLDFETDKSNSFVLIGKKRFPLGQLLAVLTEDDESCSLAQQILEMVCPMSKLEVRRAADKLVSVGEPRGEYYTMKGDDAEKMGNTLYGCFLFSDLIVDDKVIALAGTMITDKILNEIPEGRSINIVNLKIQHADHIIKAIHNMKVWDKATINTKIASLIRPNEQLKGKVASGIFQKSFFDETKYNLSDIGRAKLNYKLKTNTDSFALSKEDVILIIRTLFGVLEKEIPVDHPDSLMNRRIRCAGELVGNQIQQAIVKMVRSMQDKMVFSSGVITLSGLINSRYFVSAIREFFGTSPLCQVQDQTGYLASTAHSRRLTALGPGGVQRERAFAEVRFLHQTHYGRVCLTETPEGCAIGLVLSQTLYSKIDEYGFISAPYKKVVKGKILDEIEYLSCIQEVGKIIAYYDRNFMLAGNITGELIDCRRNDEHYLAAVDEITHIDVTPKQLVSLSVSLLPFANHCDAARIVMGANMQRQALPLIKPTAALIGTGMESAVVRDSGSSLISKTSGTVAYVSNSVIIIRNDDTSESINTAYHLTKFARSNDSTVLNQTPTVSLGEKIAAGDIIAIPEASQGDEIALGRNLKAAFLSWKGLNYEDAIVVSSKVAQSYSSLSLTKFEISIRDMRCGVEQWTRDLPNFSPNAFENLDEYGIIELGTHVKEGDILVGKITPKTEATSSPAERLIRAIFGTKGSDVDAAPLCVPPRARGTVVDIRVLSREGAPKNKRIIEIEKQMIDRHVKNRDLQLKILSDSFKTIAGSILGKNDTGATVEELLNKRASSPEYKKAVESYKAQRDFIIAECERECQKELEGDSLPSGVLQTIQVFISTKYVLQVGDKMAGRHGNKGIVSVVLDESEMPYTADGEPVDIIFRSTGISGRMNVGQVLETHLGWASVNLGKKIKALLEQIDENEGSIEELKRFLLKIYDKPKEREIINNKDYGQLIDFADKLKDGIPFSCPAFEGPGIDRIKELLELADCDPSGKEVLYHPDTGEALPQKVTVGILYVQQLHHLIEKKEHARSVGPYSVITQQPLGGRAQMGGQRLGEMECWALQAHSAAYTTREMVTVKSDCPAGRARIFQLITQGFDVFKPVGVPESFAVLVHELRALGFNIECLKFSNNQFTSHEVNTLTSIDAIKISVASSEDILSWSYGEVKKPETIHYRTFRPHPEGIFSTKIFGPIKDYNCLCGKYKGYRKKGIICSKCHTEVASSNVRRYRCGHINLACPVAHVWFTKVLPSRISIVLNMSNANLNKILRLEYYVVINPGMSPKQKGTIISETEYFTSVREYVDTGFTALTGAEAIDHLLKSIDLPQEISSIKHQLSLTNQISLREKLLKRLQILDSFYRHGARLDSMILKRLSVLPADLRPLLPIDGGRFASSDLNDLYRRVINRNNRLLKMMSFATPHIIIKNEIRMLQEAVDALLDNSRRSQPVTTANKRPLKSLADGIKGKQGRFRQNLLGKRVDYSARSVIVIGPSLKLHQCGLPKSIALELFRPFLLSRLMLRGFVSNPKAAKLMIDKKRDEVYDILREVMSEHVVLLNRAPTLHRLGIQAFRPILVEGKAIHLHPLTCKAYNADCDGDQQAVYVPLSIEAQLEASRFMMSTKCIINPANASIIASPTTDIVLGLYAMTVIEKGFKGDGMRFSSFIEAEHALSLGFIRYSTPIKVLVNQKLTDTTYGRLELYNAIPKLAGVDFDTVNKPLTSKDIQNILGEVFSHTKEDVTVQLLDELMRLGFKYATECGATFSCSDLPVPKDKAKLISAAKQLILEHYRQYREGLILREDLYNKIVSVWIQCADDLGQKLIKEMSKVEDGHMMNPVTTMMVSGARGSEIQIRQLSAMKGLVTKADGSLHESPVINSFVEGISPVEYMISSQGARKALADIAFKTADSGYFTRRLAAVAQDVVTKGRDCGTKKFIEIHLEGSEFSSLHERAFGRTAAEDIFDNENNLIIPANEIIDKYMAQKIQENSITKIKIRSPITCEAGGSKICCKCYGYDLSTITEIEEHTAIGIIAAQSIGEPGTQLTMKNFHAGGAAQNVFTDSKILAIADGTVSFNSTRSAEYKGKNVVVSRNNLLTITNSRNDAIGEYRVPQGSFIFVKDGDLVKKGDTLAEWDGYMSTLVAEKDGVILFKDLIPDTTCREAIDNIAGVSTFIVTKEADWFNPAVFLSFGDEEIEYPLQIEDTILVKHEQQVFAGQPLIRRIRNIAKTQDIIGGLEKVMALFEAAKPKNPCIIACMEGVVDIKNSGLSKKITVKNGSSKREYQAPKNANIIVNRGDFVKIGDALTDGKPCLHDILRINGLMSFARWMIKETQSVYKMQGITIGQIHLEVAIRQMLQSVTITDPGSTNYNKGETVDLSEIDRVNEILKNLGHEPVQYELLLSGITRATINNKESFISAAAFQETPKILIDAALRHEFDAIEGIKATMMTGQLMPIGVGGIVRDLKSAERDEMLSMIRKSKIEHLLNIEAPENGDSSNTLADAES